MCLYKWGTDEILEQKENKAKSDSLNIIAKDCLYIHIQQRQHDIPVSEADFKIQN